MSALTCLLYRTPYHLYCRCPSPSSRQLIPALAALIATYAIFASVRNCRPPRNWQVISTAGSHEPTDIIYWSMSATDAWSTQGVVTHSLLYSLHLLRRVFNLSPLVRMPSSLCYQSAPNSLDLPSMFTAMMDMGIVRPSSRPSHHQLAECAVDLLTVLSPVE